ncbi:hypothetical protein H2201_006271 [Coniosporium apollinis]|uniref:F-box domain-containing protein n=1 Tax=Coniosporium apollinis TaxID=61459 RepID=A0ABQ9NMD0_9PEZI|nr:hypothetical protein H2201_006271 [Coniosporium apollinis]
MVVIVDLDDEVHDPHSDTNGFASLTQLRHSLGNAISSDDEDDARPNPNINGFSAILSCYPIVSELASHLDLNSLHDLSRTCRQFRANLLQYRNQLVTQTLRCSNEDLAPSARLGRELLAAHAAWRSNGLSNGSLHPGRITSGKNCTIKPPSANTLKGRYRRLCRTCIHAPLSCLTSPQASQTMCSPSSPSPPPPAHEPDTSFTASAFSRGPCTCTETIWLCATCGNSLKNADTSYTRAWVWRKQYSHIVCGLGTGIGEGYEGVKCGREADCLASKVVEQEMVCTTEELEEMEREAARRESEGGSWVGTSYLMQEIEGIGGVVKKKVKRRVRVGAVVREHEDERDTGSYLRREQQGLVRSWCAWCERVIPDMKDLERVNGDVETDWSSSASSASSSSGRTGL